MRSVSISDNQHQLPMVIRKSLQTSIFWVTALSPSRGPPQINEIRGPAPRFIPQMGPMKLFNSYPASCEGLHEHNGERHVYILTRILLMAYHTVMYSPAILFHPDKRLCGRKASRLCWILWNRFSTWQCVKWGWKAKSN